MKTVYFVGGFKNGHTIKTKLPKDDWWFEDNDYQLQHYQLMRVVDQDGDSWWVARHFSLDESQALELFTEHIYVPNRLRGHHR